MSALVATESYRPLAITRAPQVSTGGLGKTAKRSEKGSAVVKVNANDRDDRSERELLDRLARTIEESELAQLEKKPGFNEPNTFDFDQMRRPLRDLRLPDTDHYEYLWAISECGLESFADCTCPMSLYIAALYVHCNRKHIWTLTVQGDYYFMLVESAAQDAEAIETVKCWLPRLFDTAGADVGYEPRLAHFSWLTLSHIGRPPEPSRLAAVHRALRCVPSPDWLGELYVGERGVAAWRDLYSRVCAVGGHQRSDFDEFFLGR